MNDPIPTAPTTATKAYVGAAIATAVAVLGSVGVALTDNVITPAEWVAASLAGLVALGGVFGGVYVTTNRPKH